MHQHRVFCIIHKRTIDSNRSSFTPSELVVFWADLLVNSPNGRDIDGVTIFGIGRFPTPLKDGTVVMNPDQSRFISIFKRKADGISWEAGSHNIKREGFLSRLLGGR